MNELIEDYQRKISSVNELLKNKYNDEETINRLKIKVGCYRSFLTDLKRALNIDLVSQRTYFFDCWNVGGKTFTKEIKASCKEHAILKFEKEYDSFGYDEPYVG